MFHVVSWGFLTKICIPFSAPPLRPLPLDLINLIMLDVKLTANATEWYRKKHMATCDAWLAFSWLIVSLFYPFKSKLTLIETSSHCFLIALCFGISCTLLQTQDQWRCQATLQAFSPPARTHIECKPPATGHPRRKYSWFPNVTKQTSRWFQNSLSC